MNGVQVDVSAVEEEWKLRGFGCDMWVDPPGQVWSDFEHDCDELILVVEGELEIEVAGSLVRPLAGEEVLVPSGTLHTVRNVGSTTARWLYGYRSNES